MRPFILAVGLAAGTVTTSFANDELIKDFCFSLQASMICDDLRTHMQTESRIEAIVGGSFRSHPACMAGLMEAFEEEESDPVMLCENTWRRFGCNGVERAGLVMQNPFSLDKPTLCEFRS